MSESVTIPSDSENYDGNNELSSSPPSSSSSPVVLYTPPTIWGLARGAAINLVLPFINGLMLGFGELFAHEIAFRLGWSGTKVGLTCTPPRNDPLLNRPQIFPSHRSNTRRVGPGVQMQSDPVRRRRRSGEEIDMYAALE
ncbi:outer membrane protein TOM13-domain-containing protein [Macrophomina phaseolina]|uniref:Outer membrane protein TOM13-domain-containing protein n=1 Tax=Macrophomina phaseolina TaxID=35725 RepID=A0ABQ8FQG9_9PEZI|nr:outer membrane protein TOM13-domain-containing protein [Macrophomina phaseolina]